MENFDDSVIHQKFKALECQDDEKLKCLTLIQLWNILAEAPSASFNKLPCFFRLLECSHSLVLCPKWKDLPRSHKRLLSRAVGKYCLNCPDMGPQCTSFLEAIIAPWGVFPHTFPPGESDIELFLQTEGAELLATRIEKLYNYGYIEHAQALCWRCLTRFSGSELTACYFEPKELLVLPSRHVFQSWDLILHHFDRESPDVKYIADTVKDLSCHEGLRFILIMWYKCLNATMVTEALCSIFLIKEFADPDSKFCCTEQLSQLWCQLREHQDLDALRHDVSVLASMASTSKHFFFLASSLWKQFHKSVLPLFLELQVRGLSIDVNHFLAVRDCPNFLCNQELACDLSKALVSLAQALQAFDEQPIIQALYLAAFNLEPVASNLDLVKDVFTAQSRSPDLSKMSRLSPQGEKQNSEETNQGSQPPPAKKRKRGLFKIEPHPILDASLGGVSPTLLVDLSSLIENIYPKLSSVYSFTWEDIKDNCHLYMDTFNSLLKKSKEETHLRPCSHCIA